MTGEGAGRSEHFALLEAVNNSTTEEERQVAKARLDGWRMAAQSVGGRRLGGLVIEGDWFYLDEDEDEDDCRPMCGGEFLDWKPGNADG